jgi:hypothetical protein
MYRFTALTSALVAGLASAAPAQASRAFPFALIAQVSYVPLYGGGATEGPGYAGFGPSLRLAYEPRFAHGRAFVEGHGTRTFAGGTLYKPQLTSLGVMLGASLGRRTGPVRGLVAAGLSRLHVDVEDDTPCLPPLCFTEGGRSFRDAELTTLTAGAGIVVPGGDRLGLRVDLRVHAPFSSDSTVGDSGDTRFELALGLLIRW